jgi:hypothetical protein
MAYPILTAEQKFNVRDRQLRITNLNNVIQNYQRQLQAEQQSLRGVLESIAAEGKVDSKRASFDLDSLTFQDLPNAAPAPAPKAPAAKKVTAPKAVAPAPKA